MCVLASYSAAVCVNAVRIAVAMWLAAHPAGFGGMTAAQVHRVEGIACYFGGLVLLYQLVQYVDRGFGPVGSGAEGAEGACPPKHVRIGQCEGWVPLFWYLVITVAVPLANGAASGGTFYIEHTLFVLAVPLVLVALAAGGRELVRALRRPTHIAVPTLPTDRTRRPFVIKEAIAILARTPATLDAMLRGLPDGWIAAHEGGETWSPFDVIGHLIHGERTDWVPRARSFSSTARRAPSRSSIASRSSRCQKAERSPACSTNSRRRAGEPPGAGGSRGDHRGSRSPRPPSPTRRRDAAPVLATWVAHDLDHVVQVSRVLARQYADEVGPWHAYLRIISGTQG